MSEDSAQTSSTNSGVPIDAGVPSPQSPAPVSAAPARAGGSALGTLALIVALAAGGAAGYHWYQDRGADNALRHELAKRLSDMEGQNREAVARTTQAAAALREAEVKLGVLEAKVAESQGQQSVLEALHQDLSRNRDESAIADIEQSVQLASQQLQIAGNVRAALMALENADTRLQRIDQPRYAALRRTLTRDIDRLKALPQADLYGISARIEEAIAAIDTLPLAMEARARPDVSVPATMAGMPQWERMLREAWAELRQLVRVQSTGVQDAALLAPEQVFFLRENLKLRLLGARIALLSRDTRSYQGDLRAALTALERHFDAQDGTVAAITGSLRKLQAAQLQTELPDLTESLEVLRKLRLPRAKGPA